MRRVREEVHQLRRGELVARAGEERGVSAEGRRITAHQDDAAGTGSRDVLDGAAAEALAGRIGDDEVGGSRPPAVDIQLQHARVEVSKVDPRVRDG